MSLRQSLIKIECQSVLEFKPPTIIYRNKHALIIGINKYPRDPLNYCINDAKDLKIALEQIGFNVILGIDCNFRQFLHLIDEFSTKIHHDDLALFYYAAHGRESRGENFFFPSDYDYDYRDDEHDYIVNHTVKVTYILKKLNDVKLRVIICLFDCCRSLVRTRSTNAHAGLSLMGPTANSFIVYACAPGRAVRDETRNNRNGCFMEHLLQHIKMPKTDIEAIMKRVAYGVVSATNNSQQPQRVTSLTGEVFLVNHDNQSKI